MPTVPGRDLVIIDRSQKTRVDRMGETIWAIVYRGGDMIKCLRPQTDGTIEIMSDNQLVADGLVIDNDRTLSGHVVASVRRH